MTITIVMTVCFNILDVRDNNDTRAQPRIFSMLMLMLKLLLMLVLMLMLLRMP